MGLTVAGADLKFLALRLFGQLANQEGTFTRFFRQVSAALVSMTSCAITIPCVLGGSKAWNWHASELADWSAFSHQAVVGAGQGASQFDLL